MEQKFYLNFKEATGEIWKVTNELDVSTPYVEVDRQTMKDFAEQRKRMSDYIIVPSSDENLKYEIKFKHKDLLQFDVDKSVHHLPKVETYDTNNAFVIKQNIKNGTWVIHLTEKLRELLNSTLYYKDKNQIIYVTEKDNPNVLLDTLDIKMYNILHTNSYQLENYSLPVAKNLNVSLYCGKAFDNYFHIQET